MEGHVMDQVVGELCECGKCKRKIVIERILIGVNHTTKTIIYCWDCLSDEDRDNYIKAYGDAIKVTK